MDALILLPPSETKRAGGTGRFDPASGRFAALDGGRFHVAAALSAAMGDPGAVRSLTGLRPERAGAAVAANRCVVGAPTMAAGQRYQGVVWSHLDTGSLSGTARRRAGQIVVVSAVGGLFGHDDPTPDYKAKIGVSLPGVGPLAAFWAAQTGPALKAAADGRAVWDLLTVEHRRAVDLSDFEHGQVVRVEFRRADGAGAAGHAAKAAKGCFARHLLAAGASARQAGRFSWEGWQADVRSETLVVVTAPGR